MYVYIVWRFYDIHTYNICLSMESRSNMHFDTVGSTYNLMVVSIDKYTRNYSVLCDWLCTCIRVYVYICVFVLHSQTLYCRCGSKLCCRSNLSSLLIKFLLFDNIETHRSVSRLVIYVPVCTALISINVQALYLTCMKIWNNNNWTIWIKAFGRFMIMIIIIKFQYKLWQVRIWPAAYIYINFSSRME